MYKIYNEECILSMKKLPNESIDMILADLPYGSTKCAWDIIIPFVPLWEQYKRIIKKGGAIVLFGSQPFTSLLISSNLLMFKHEYIWFKNVPTGMAQAAYAPMKYHENILVFAKGKILTFNKKMQEREGEKKECYNYEHYCGESNHVKMNKVKKFYDVALVNPSTVLLFNTVPNRINKLHPTQKPVELLEYLIKTYTLEGETVLDNTMGSGSTGVACIHANRNFIGMELDEKYFLIARNRLKEEDNTFKFGVEGI
jgi:site-specific DNA-methyltransferase (adenine-specific)